jgi:hypothetical protein
MRQKTYSQQDAELRTLLNLNGIIYPLENGYWVKFGVKKVKPTAQIPHGISYSLTLHDRNNTRVIGYDNAHSVRRKIKGRKKYTARKISWDHKHHQDTVTEYNFESASQLIDDFWNNVDGILKD